MLPACSKSAFGIGFGKKFSHLLLLCTLRRFDLSVQTKINRLLKNHPKRDHKIPPEKIVTGEKKESHVYFHNKESNILPLHQIGEEMTDDQGA